MNQSPVVDPAASLRGPVGEGVVAHGDAMGQSLPPQHRSHHATPRHALKCKRFSPDSVLARQADT
jgi:hypothetical protein